MPDLNVFKVNEAYIKIDCDSGISHELAEAFSFYANNYQFHPLVKKKLWDGKIKLFDKRYNVIYRGLLDEIIKFAEEREYTIAIDDELTLTEEFSIFEAGRFVEKLNLPSNIENRDFQIETFVSCIRNKRELFISPTASGKSLILYMICRYLLEKDHKKGLIIVPNVSLVNQLYSNFKEDFHWNNIDDFVYKIYDYKGMSKHTSHPLLITTWQSLQNMPEDYFKQFDFILGDEAHTFNAKELTSIMTNLSNTKYRIGCTGSLDGTKVNELALRGLFGPIKQYVTTKELIDRKDLSDLIIKCLVLRYSDEEIKELKGVDYQKELDYVITKKERNNFIKNLALSLKGNTLILFQYVEKHGKVLYDLLTREQSDKKIYLIYQNTPPEERERIRKEAEFIDNAILIASYGVFSTGINIKNLHNYIQASPTKSKIRVLQSIGRVLRTCYGKSIATLFDLVDDIRSGKKENHLLGHFKERLSVYRSQQFKFKLYKIELKGKK